MNSKIKQRIEQINRGEVPQGYKKTKIGIVPNEWDQIKFDSLIVSYCEYTNDLEQYPLYSLTIEDGIVKKTERYERSHLVKKENSYKILPPNYYAYNPMNIRFGAVSRHKGSQEVSVSGYYDIFTTKNKSDLTFMDSFLVSNEMINYYNKVSTGSLVEKQRVHFSQFIDFELPLPNQKQRKMIADILSTQDRVIELKEKLIEEKKKQKKYLMQNLLTGKFRLKGFDGKWKKVKLDEICEFIRNGYTYIEAKDEFVKITRIETISSGNVDVNSIGYAKPNIDSKYILKKGDILYSHINSISQIGKTAYFDLEEKIYHGMNLLCIRSSKKINSKYLFFWFNTYEAKKLAYSYSKKAINQCSISAGELLKYKILIPSVEEQNAIAEILSTADKEIELLEQELEQEKLKKKSLMQLLLTGIVRVEGENLL